MSELNPLDSVEINENSKTVKVLGIFTIVGNALLLLILVILQFMVDQYFGYAGEKVMLFIRVFMAIFCVLPILGIVGSIMMMKGKRKGFYIYMIANSLFITLMLYSLVAQSANNRTDLATIFVTLGLPIIFLILFSFQFKKLS